MKNTIFELEVKMFTNRYPCHLDSNGSKDTLQAEVQLTES